MSEEQILENSLVLYKRRPARVVKGGERLEIEIDDGNRAKVRPKDVALLHPRPAAQPGCSFSRRRRGRAGLADPARGRSWAAVAG